MKNLSNKLFIIFALLATPLFLSAGDAERKAANELLEASRFDKVMDNSINASVQMLKQMNPQMASHEAKLRQFYQKYMGAESLRNEVSKLYSEMFSEKELKELTAFYKTTTGQKALEKLPELMQRSMQLAQSRVMEHMGELEKMLSEDQTS